MSTHRSDDPFNFFQQLQQQNQQDQLQAAQQNQSTANLEQEEVLQQAVSQEGSRRYVSSIQPSASSALTGGCSNPAVPPKPNLSSPLNFSNQFCGMTSSGTNLISIMAQVLILQALSNSNFWQTTWQQATQQMMSSIELAPTIAAATQANWNEQAHVSELQGQESLVEGIVNTIAFTAAMGLGAWSSATDPANEAKNTPDPLKATSEDATQPSTASETSLSPEGNPSSPMDDATVDESTSPKEQSTWGKMKNAWGKLSAIYGKGGAVLKSITKGLEMGNGLMMFTTGMTGIQKKIYQVKIAGAQQLVGTYQAATEQLQAYAQFYENAFNRINSINQGSAQQISSIADTISQIASAISQAISTGFSRI